MQSVAEPPGPSNEGRPGPALEFWTYDCPRPTTVAVGPERGQRDVVWVQRRAERRDSSERSRRFDAARFCHMESSFCSWSSAK